MTLSMLKKVFYCISLTMILFQVKTVHAQDPQFSQYYAAPLYLNPGLAGINQKGRIGVNYRSQWPNLDASFETFSAYADYYIEEYRSAVGLIFTTDQEGIAGLRSTTVGLQYAYQLQLNYNWIFRPGVEFAYTNQDLNFDKLIFGDQLDNNGLTGNPTGEVFDTGLQSNFFDLSFGGIFYNRSVWVGGAMHHVTEPNQSLDGGNAPLDRKFSIHGGYRIPLRAEDPRKSGQVSVTPSFNYRAQGDFDQLDLGAFFTLDPVLVGLWYRGLPIKSVENVTNNESLIFMLGLQSKRTTFGYSFDYTISDLGIGTGGAHEISIVYSFNLGDPRKPTEDVRKLRCPIPYLF